MRPLPEVFRSVHGQAGEDVKSRVDEEVGPIDIDEGRIGGEPGNDWIDSNALHGGHHLRPWFGDNSVRCGRAEKAHNSKVFGHTDLT